MMPTVLKAGPFRFFFFSNEGDEPRHIHVESEGGYAKLWLEPVSIANAIGYKGRELNKITRFVIDNAEFFKEKWNAHFGFED